MKLASMKLTPKEKKEVKADMEYKPPEYGYGTQLSLDGDQLAALGMSASETVGTVFNIAGEAKVVGTNTRQRENGESYSCVELQITSLGAEKQADAAELAKSMYPKQGS